MIHLTETRSASLYTIDGLHLTRGRREVARCLAPKLSTLWATRYAESPIYSVLEAHLIATGRHTRIAIIILT
jgi:hypothetical protein